MQFQNYTFYKTFCTSSFWVCMYDTLCTYNEFELSFWLFIVMVDVRDKEFAHYLNNATYILLYLRTFPSPYTYLRTS